MRIHCQFNAPIEYDDLGDYVRNHDIEIKCYDEDGLLEFTVAKISMDQIMYWDAINDEVSMFDICDNDSQGMRELNVILSEGKDEFRSDLEIDTFIDYIIFVHRAVFHPDIYPFRQAILNAVFNLFGRSTLAVTWMNATGLQTKELADIGFRRVVQSNLIYRQSALKNIFDHEPIDLSDALLLDATEQQEEWVMAEWKRIDE